jgi:tetratricopeptide (TPR) repeat protein
MKASTKRASVPQAPQPAFEPRRLFAIAALCAVALLAYANSFSSGFVLDNRGLLLQDPRIRETTTENLNLILQHTYWWPYGESGLYRPFTTLTYLFNYAILGNADRAAGYHWINFLLHAGNVLLVYALARRLFRDWWPSVWMAALWAVHPVLTESVTNMIGRADLLAGMTLLGGFLMYLKSTESRGAVCWAWLAGLAAATTVGVFAKESAATILGVIVVYELIWWRERRQGPALVAGCVAVLAALEAMWYARAAVFSHLPPTRFPYWDNPLVDAGFWEARLTALKVMAKYLGLLFWPAHLSCDYSYAQIPMAAGAGADWLAWLVVAAAAGAVVYLYGANRPLFFLCVMACVTFLPMSNLLFPIGTIMAERFLYLPAIAAAAVVVCGCYAMARRAGKAKLAPVALSLILAACTARTWARNADWQDDMSLMKATLATSPGSFKSHKLAAGLYDSDPGNFRIDEALAEAEKSLAILHPVEDWHNNPDSYRRAGGYYQTEGDQLAGRGADGGAIPSAESRKAYQRSLALLLRARSIVKATAEWAAAHRRFGEVVPRQADGDDAKVADLEGTISAVELRLGDVSQALERATTAQRMEPAAVESYRRLSAAYLAAGRADDAAVALVEGTLVTSDVGLRRQLMDLYRGGLDTEGCATKPGPYGPAMNPSCGMVRRHMCLAASLALELYSQMGRADLVEKTKVRAASLGCR